MFRFTTYLRMRWVSIAFFFLAGVFILWLWTSASYGLDFQQWAKLMHTKASLWLSQNLWGHAVVTIGTLILLWIGVSTVLVLLPVIFLWPPLVSGAVVIASHLGLVWYKCRKHETNPTESLLPPSLGNELPKLSGDWVTAICLKLFLNIPGQAIDLILLEKKSDEVSIKKIRAAIMIGTTLRVFIAWIWAGNLVSVLVNFHPFPERVLSVLLLCTAAIMWGLIWAFVPELLPAEKNLKQACCVLFGGSASGKEPAAADNPDYVAGEQGSATQKT